MGSYQDYLEVKRTIDDRSLNQRVFRSLLDRFSVPGRQRVLEIGSGIGTMVARGLEWGLLEDVEFTAIDVDPQNFEYARSYLDRWATENKYSIERPDPGSILLTNGKRKVLVDLRVADVHELIESGRPGGWDLLIAHLFLDLVDVSRDLRPLIGLIEPGGLFYFSLVFDGSTILRPTIDPELDDLLISTYHRTMDRRMPPGAHYRTSETGRHVLERLVDMPDVEIIDVGSSDWIVCPRSNGYSREEAAFLGFILDMISEAVMKEGEIEGGRIKEWMEERRDQVRKGKLIYMAHQIDILGSVVGRRPTQRR